MENLDQFIRTNMLSKNEEQKLDRIVLNSVNKKKISVWGIFYKFAVTVFIFLLLGLGIYLLPEEQQRQVIKPVSAQEVLLNTYNTLEKLINTNGVLHYKSTIKFEHEKINDYDTFQTEAFIATKKPYYKINYLKTRSAGEEVTIPREDGVLQFQQFPQEKITLFNDGVKEYYYNTYTEPLNRPQSFVNSEYKIKLNGLLDFYKFLLTNNSEDYNLIETTRDGRPVYEITFDYEGLVLNPNNTPQGFELLTKEYISTIIIDKESQLPVLHSTRVKDNSYIDSHTEIFGPVEILPAETIGNIFDFESLKVNYRESEDKSTVLTSPEATYKGKIIQEYLAEDFIPIYLQTDSELLELWGSLFREYVTGKTSILGKYLIGKNVELTGYLLSYEGQKGHSLVVENIDFEQFARKKINKITTTPTSFPTVKQQEYRQSTLTFSNKLNELEGGDKFSLTYPVNAQLIPDESDYPYTIKGNNFKLEIGSDYEDEGYSGTEYTEGYQKLTNNSYGDFYRVQTTALIEEYGEGAYTYVDSTNFKSTGTCEGFYSDIFGPAQAPCGDGMLFLVRPGQDIETEASALFRIICTSQEQTGLEECDKIVASLKKI